jgi:hypothetical protein
LELANRAANPIDPLTAGPSLPLSLSLYREAAYWALVAQSPTTLQPSDLADAFASVAPEVRTFAAGNEAGVAAVQEALITKTFRETAADLPEQQRADAKDARAFVEGLISRQLGAERRIGRAVLQRWVRLSVALAVLLGASIGLTMLVTTLTTAPNLAAGKPWHASSTLAGIPKASNHEYLFHTQDEDNPWYEVDLKAPTLFSVVQVTNRTDCCPERAAPAAIEVSSDHTHWKEVSRRADSYSVWTAKFAPTTARYVRVRVLRHSILHLAAVAVRAH